MRKTRKLGIQKQVKKKQKSKRRGRGKEDEVPFLIKSMLSNVHLKTFGQEFHDNGKPSLVSYILQDLPRASVTIALQKQELINKKTIAEKELDTYIHYAKSVHDRMKEAHAKLTNLYEEKEELEKTIESSELGKKFYKLETQHKELVSNKSMLNRSQASLVSLRLASIRYGILRKEFNKLDALIKKIRKEYQISLVARDEQLEAYRQEHKLLKILGDLESQLEDLRTQERMLNST